MKPFLVVFDEQRFWIIFRYSRFTLASYKHRDNYHMNKQPLIHTSNAPPLKQIYDEVFAGTSKKSILKRLLLGLRSCYQWKSVINLVYVLAFFVFCCCSLSFFLHCSGSRW